MADSSAHHPDEKSVASKATVESQPSGQDVTEAGDVVPESTESEVKAPTLVVSDSSLSTDLKQSAAADSNEVQVDEEESASTKEENKEQLGGEDRVKEHESAHSQKGERDERTEGEEADEGKEEGNDETEGGEVEEPTKGDRLSDEESYHSPGEEDYKSESDDDASGLLRGRRREASDEEDEEDDEEDAVSVAEEEGEGQGQLGMALDGTQKGEGAYESDGAAGEDTLEEGDDLLDEESEDMGADEGKAEEDEAAPNEEPVPVPKAEVKKPAEPFVVPTAGPFYMHDDRFGGEEPKRPGKGKKLWEGTADSDERWPHDMFEKLNLANDEPPPRRDDGGRRRGSGGYARGGGRGEGAGYGNARGGRGRGRGFRNTTDGGRRNFAAADNAPSSQPESDPGLLSNPQYNLELLQEFPPPQANTQNWGSPANPVRQATANGASSYNNGREQGREGGQTSRGNISGGQKAAPAWADSVPEQPTGWGEEAQERGSVSASRGRGGRRGSGDVGLLGRGQGAGRGENKPRTPQRGAPPSNNGSAPGGATGWTSEPPRRQSTDTQASQMGYGGTQSTGWEDRSAGGDRERALGPPPGRNATVGTMTSPRPLEQKSPRDEAQKRYQQTEQRPMPASRREIEVQTDLPEVSPGPRNAATTPRGGAKAGPPPGFQPSQVGTDYGSSAPGGTEYNAQYRAPANASGRSSPSLHLANEYVPHSAAQQVLPYGQTAVPPVGGYSLPPYPGHLPPYAYGSGEVTWVPVLNNPQGNTLPPPPQVYATNPYASPYGAEASPYLYPSQAVAPPEYAPAAAKQGLNANAAISRPPSASTLWKPPVPAGGNIGALDSGADAYGSRQSKPRRYTEMSF